MIPAFSMDAGAIAELWRMNPEQNTVYPLKLSGQTIMDVQWKDGKVYFDLDGVTVISDPNDIYAFEKPDNFVLREDLEK